MIYTSYFASNKYDIKDGVSVARYVKFSVSDYCPELYPSKSLLEWYKGLPVGVRSTPEYIEKYTNLYIEQTLSKLDVHELAKRLNNKVLLCYEKSSDFCHRHIIAKWFRDNGYGCEEL